MMSSFEALLRESIVDEAKTWLGTPYHHQAHIKGAGVDCVQILIEVYHAALGITKPDLGYYAPDWMLHREEERYLAGLEDFATPVDIPQAGDVVIYKFGRCFSHSGIVVRWPLIIHAHRDDNCCYADGLQGVLAGREMKFYTFIGEDEK